MLIGASAVILNAQGHVLLVKHTYGRLNWELPGGHGEPGEAAGETALREVREETSLHVRAEHLTGIYYEPEVDMHHFVFSCHRLDEREIPHLIRMKSPRAASGRWMRFPGRSVISHCAAFTTRCARSRSRRSPGFPHGKGSPTAVVRLMSPARSTGQETWTFIPRAGRTRAGRPGRSGRAARRAGSGSSRGRPGRSRDRGRSAR